MDEEKYQKELFNEFEKKPRRFFPKLSNLFPKSDFERNVILTLTLDRAVFITIGIIMVMVVVYAMGVEKGKELPVNPVRDSHGIKSAAISNGVKSAPIAPSATAPVKAAPAPAVNPVRDSHGIKSAAISNGVKALPAIKALSYTILAVTLTRKETAVRETQGLRAQGYNAFIIQSGTYFQVCVGAYADKTGAESQKDLKNIKRLYRDAYLKSRN